MNYCKRGDTLGLDALNVTYSCKCGVVRIYIQGVLRTYLMPIREVLVHNFQLFFFVFVFVCLCLLFCFFSTVRGSFRGEKKMKIKAYKREILYIQGQRRGDIRDGKLYECFYFLFRFFVFVFRLIPSSSSGWRGSACNHNPEYLTLP